MISDFCRTSSASADPVFSKWFICHRDTHVVYMHVLTAIFGTNLTNSPPTLSSSSHFSCCRPATLVSSSWVSSLTTEGWAANWWCVWVGEEVEKRRRRGEKEKRRRKRGGKEKRRRRGERETVMWMKILPLAKNFVLHKLESSDQPFVNSALINHKCKLYWCNIPCKHSSLQYLDSHLQGRVLTGHRVSTLSTWRPSMWWE